MPQRFVIVGIQRTGTTWIRTTLDSHPSILALGEVFLYSHGRFPFRRKAGLDVANSYRHFVQGSLWRRMLHSFNRSAVVNDYLRHLYSQPGYEAIGFKLMRTHCNQFPTVVPYLLSEQIPVIHVVRRNVLKTLISRETAKRRKLFHARSDVPVEKIAVDVDTLVAALQQIADDNDAWERTFADSPYLQVSYESFVNDKSAELTRIYDFLSIRPVADVSSSLVKINPDTIRDVLLNYDDVCRVLDGTPFAACLAR